HMNRLMLEELREGDGLIILPRHGRWARVAQTRREEECQQKEAPPPPPGEQILKRVPGEVHSASLWMEKCSLLCQITAPVFVRCHAPAVFVHFSNSRVAGMY